MYKRYADQTKEEKSFNKWLEKGRPRIIWDSSKRGTCTPRLNAEHKHILESTSNNFRAKYVGSPKMQAHKRKLLLS